MDWIICTPNAGSDILAKSLLEFFELTSDGTKLRLCYVVTCFRLRGVYANDLIWFS